VSEHARLLELLADRATQGLGPREASELERLALRFPDEDLDAFDRAAAAVDRALAPSFDTELPPSLRERLEVDAGHALAALAQGGSRPSGVSSVPGASRGPAGGAPRRVAPRRPRALAAAGWLAAAAMAGVALLVWRADADRDARLAGLEAALEARAERLAERRDTLEARAEALERREAALAAAPSARRAALLAAADDVIRREWSATGDPAAPDAGGDVVWSSDAQAGFMRFRGLAPNDPTENQYQLWIFDATRDERHPVDGGVFDVDPATGEVVVPIRAKLPVREPTLFAVTVERPGGVVVSSRERIALVAKVGG